MTDGEPASTTTPAQPGSDSSSRADAPPRAQRVGGDGQWRRGAGRAGRGAVGADGAAGGGDDPLEADMPSPSADSANTVHMVALARVVDL